MLTFNFKWLLFPHKLLNSFVKINKVELLMVLMVYSKSVIFMELQTGRQTNTFILKSIIQRHMRKKKKKKINKQLL